MILTAEQLQALPINNAALQRLPESIARENVVLPISIKDGILHVVLPMRGLGADDALLDKLNFVLNVEISFDVAKLDDLSPIVDLHYTGYGSEIQNCDQKLSFHCPKQWAQLQITPTKDIRFCTVCQKNVTFCKTQNQLDSLVAAGECVAFIIPIDSGEICELMGFVALPPRKRWWQFWKA